MNSCEPEKEFVFIVTYGRSGSTLLQAVLQSIEGYFIRGENANALWHLYRSYQSAHDARFQHGVRPIADTGPWFGADKIVPDDYGAALAQVFIEKILQPPSTARVIGFKEIRFHEGGTENIEEFLNFISKFFPPAKFIFNTRNWEDVSKSGWWANMDPKQVKTLVESCDVEYRKFVSKHPDIGHLICYDDVKDQPEKFKPLFEFLGEPFDATHVGKIMGNRFSQFKF